MKYLFSFMEKYEVKILSMENKQESLQSQIDVSMDKLKRLKQDQQRGLWDLEKKVTRDCVTKSDQETLMTHFKDFVKSNSKYLKNLVLQQQKANQDAMQDFMRLFQQFIKMQNDQMASVVDLTVSNGGISPGRKRFTGEPDGGFHRRHHNGPLEEQQLATRHTGVLNDENSMSESLTRTRHRRKSRRDSESSSFDTSDSSASKPKRYNEKSATDKKEKKYIQDILHENGETEDFDDIFRGHMDAIQNQDPFGPTTFNPLGDDVDEHAESFVAPEDSQQQTKVEEEVSTQKLTQEFKDSLQSDDKLKSSNLMSFFDKYSQDPSSVQNPEPTPEEKISHTTWEVNDEVKQSVNQILADVRQTQIESVEEGNDKSTQEKELSEAVQQSTFTESAPSTENQQSTEREEREKPPQVSFEQYDFSNDDAFQKRLESYKQSGEFDQIKERMGGDENKTILKVKANYFQQAIDSSFDFDTFAKSKGIEKQPSNKKAKNRKPKLKPWEKKKH
eukprot:CAMPEP_0117441950 /NCGR_PEP_ID=MMETSP0759-20121206/3897_1 /TAXON_ID=63605 /ORGANISM="Percolomonas cosmopolitus, Strain WS" /LENGTH=502 /DNA_ID=CAMNT_0005233817 /DNA_START=184 /DNA_END=1692 /DNA_ORIENTATION=-